MAHDHDHTHAHDHAHDHAHGHGHAHAGGHAGHDHAAGANERSLRIALALTLAFTFVEFAGGIATESLALISDAAHMATDVAALAIALAAIRIGQRAVDERRTFGYARFEILAAAVNAMLLFGAAVFILVEAYRRLRQPPDLQPLGMLVIAFIGLVVNLVAMKVLAAGRDESLNIKGAYLEVWSDMLGSVGVIAGAAIIHFTGFEWVDSAVAILIGLWVLPRSWSLLKSSINILLEGVPENIDLPAVRGTLLAVPGVVDIHDLHVWALTSGQVSLTVHVVNDDRIDAEREILPRIQEELARRFRITHVTVQCERTACHQAEEGAGAHFRTPQQVLGRPVAGDAGRPEH